VADGGFASQLLCIQSDANPSLGSMYSGGWERALPCSGGARAEPGSRRSPDRHTPTLSPSPCLPARPPADPAAGDVAGNREVAQCPASAPAAPPVQPHYELRDTVLLAAATSGGAVLQLPMAVPTAALSSQCSDAPLGFLQKVPARSKVGMLL
jgi:hypothetical protein